MGRRVKHIYLALILALGPSAAGWAQTAIGGFGGTRMTLLIEVLSDSEIDEATGNTIFLGNVALAVQGDLRISAANSGGLSGQPQRG